MEPARDRLSDHSAVPAWHAMPVQDVLERLAADGERGLSDEAAATRRHEHGPNIIAPTRRTPWWAVLIGQFKDFMIYVLVVAAAISAFEGQAAEAWAILAILLLNGLLGFFQEYRAERALEALNQLAAPTATVVRSGREREIAAADLVPGDIVLIESGDTIPADGRLLSAAALKVVESALTGESAAVDKDAGAHVPASAPLGDRRTMVFAGTSVAVGRGTFVVTATGSRTEVGRIATLLSTTEEAPTPLQVELARVGRQIAVIVLLVAAIVFFEEAFLELRRAGEGLFAALEHPEFRAAITDGLLVAVALAVAAIPEGLPAIVTVALSIGVRRMAEHHAVVRRLHAVETLGSTTVICSDKTGTLTLNRMSVRRLVAGEDLVRVTPDWGIEPVGRSPERSDVELLLQIAAACNDAHYTVEGALVGDPTETALVDAAAHLAPGHLKPRRVAEVPFDAARKRMTTVHDIDGDRVAYVKGGVDVVLPRCTRARIRGVDVELDEPLRKRIEAMNTALAEEGYRTLAAAYRRLAPDERIDADPEELERELTYAGILGLLDPPRPEAREAVELCHRAGIMVAMVTGDHALTARAIATQVGILDCDRVVTGQDLDRMSADELSRAAREIRVYARVDPEHKIRIVDALKRTGAIVAMTGDGVNDAPALKRADIGVAMGRVGTDVAREAADMVLTDDNFATIVRAVREGRIVFENLRKVILYLLSCNMSEVLIVFVTALMAPSPALRPLQILWINLVTDGAPALALGSDPGSARVMEQAPRAPDEPIITPRHFLQLFIQGALMTAAGLTIFLGAGRSFPIDGPEHMNTMLFTTMVLVQAAHAFTFVSTSRPALSRTTLRNRWLNIAVAVTVALQMGVIYWPPAQRLFGTVALGFRDWSAVIAATVVPVAVIDLTKRAFSASPGRHRRGAGA